MVSPQSFSVSLAISHSSNCDPGHYTRIAKRYRHGKIREFSEVKKVVVLCGAAMVRNQTFGVITARRISIVEPNGTVFLTISNRADFLGSWNLKRSTGNRKRVPAGVPGI